MKLYIALATLLVLIGTHFYAYEKGKDSVFKGIISGQAVYQEKQEEKAKEDVKIATEATKRVVNIQHKAAERIPQLASKSPQLTDEQLSILQQIAKESQ